MDRRETDVAAIVKKMKDRAKAFSWIPTGIPPKANYHHLPDGLSLCFTLDILPREYLNRMARAIWTKVPEELAEGGKFWHLSIARLGAGDPTQKEVGFWRRAFFEEAPIMEVPGIIPAIKSRHFFWREE